MGRFVGIFMTILGSMKDKFLALVRIGIGHPCEFSLDGIDWDEVEALAKQQGLLGIVLDGVEELPKEIRPPQELLLQWIGKVHNCYESNYSLYEKRIGQLAHFYNNNGFRMMVIKGYGLSLNYPKPKHRPCGDIDIWQFGQQKEADDAISHGLGIEIDESHHHHTVFQFKEYTVENHYDWINVYVHKTSSALEQIFKELAKDDSHWVEVNGEKVYLPSPNLHALFLLKHMMLHFVATSITLRQILDWAFFVEKNRKDIDWGWLISMLEKFHMNDFFNCVSTICIDELGFEAKLFGHLQVVPHLKDRMLQDTLSPEFTEEEPDGVFKRVAFKYRRWRSNGWKRKMCYDGGDFEMFLRSTWAHVVKPAHI